MELGIYTPWKCRLSLLKNQQIFNHLFLVLQVLHKKINYLSFLAKVPQMCHHLAIKTLYFIYHFFIQTQDVGSDLYSHLFLPFEADKLKVFGHLTLIQNWKNMVVISKSELFIIFAWSWVRISKLYVYFFKMKSLPSEQHISLSFESKGYPTDSTTVLFWAVFE